MNRTIIEHQTIRLECLTPVHIGDNTKLDKTQYIYDVRNRRAYFLYEPAWIALLTGRHRLLDKFIGDLDMMQRSRGRMGLYDWCVQNGISPQNMAQVSRGWAHIPFGQQQDESLNSVAAFLRGADGSPYIPGSSIKGALRTGLLHMLIRQMSADKRQRYWTQLNQTVSSCRGIRDRGFGLLSHSIETELLHRLQYTDQYGRSQRPGDATCSSLKGLRIGDAHLTEDSRARPTLLLRKTDWSTHKDRMGNNEKNLPLSRECLAPGAVLEFSCSIDRDIMQTVGVSSVGQILQACREFAQYVLEAEGTAFGGQWARPLSSLAKTAGVILGGGTGFQSKTLVYALAPSPEAGRDTVAKMLDIAFTEYDRQARCPVPKHRHVALDRITAPRTLKLALTDAGRLRMGVCSLTPAGPSC